MLTIYPSNYNQNVYIQKSPKFTGGLPMSSVVSAEKSVRKVEFWGRKVVNRVADFFTKKKNEEIYQEIINSDVKSPEYIKTMSKVSRWFAPKHDIEINLQDKRIEEIAKSGKPHIFIMNHDSQNKDPQMLAFFNTLLNEEYFLSGQAQTCPRSKIILNEDILLAMNDKKRKVFEKMGAVPIDASIYSADTKGNAKQFISLIRGFIKGESNIFIFPEGRHSVYKNAPLNEKFQTGVGEMVAKLADKLPEVNVTPIGFAYNGGFKSAGDSIHIGKTVVFKKEGEHLLASAGNVSSKHAKDSYKEFFENRDMATITDKGVPVTGRDLADYVGGVLCENLRICREEAIEALPKKSVKCSVIEV